MNLKKYAIILIIALILLGTFLFLNRQPEPTKTAQNESKQNPKLTQDQVIEHLNINNIALTKKNKHYIFSAKVNNLTSNTLMIKSIDIIVKDQGGQTLTMLTGYIGSEIAPEESKPMTAETVIDLKNAYTLEFILNK